MYRRRRRRARLVRGSLWLYRTLLWLYPPSLRRAYGADMLQLFRDTLRDEVRCAGLPGALRAWATALDDLATTLPREWPRELRRPHGRHGLHRRRAPRNAIPRFINGRATGRVPTHSVLSGRLREPRLSMEEKFEKFTERARRVLTLSQEEAQRFNHNYIGTEHLLLGLVREGDGVAAKVLENLGVEPNKVRATVEFIIGRGDRIVLGEIGLTPRSKKVIELAVDEARRLNHHYVGTEHILLGLVREGEGIAAGVLESLGVNLEKVRAATIAALGGEDVVASAVRWTQGARPQARPDLGKFSDGARRTLGQAITEARERDQREVGTGHALLALLAEPDGAAAWALREAGIDLDAARQAVERELGPRPEPGPQPANGPVDLDAHTLRMIALAADEASAMNHRFVGAEHLLLGLIREGEGLGAQVLLTLGADVNRLRLISLRRLSDLAERERRPALGAITLACRDLPTTASFYTQRLGATVRHQPGGALGERWELRLPGGGSSLLLRPVASDAEAAHLASGVELDMLVADVALIWRTLKDADVADVGEIGDSPRGRTFTVADPDGRTLRIYAHGEQRSEQTSE